MHIPFFSDLFNFFFAKRCALCGNYLVEGEDMLCLVCQSKLPRVHAYKKENIVENRLLSTHPLQHASSFCFYNKSGVFSSLLVDAKYHNRPWYGYYLARIFATELTQESRAADGVGWPYDIDVIVPLPLHWLRRLKRGYNQTEYIARALSEVWNLPVEKRCLKRHYRHSKVGKRRQQRIMSENKGFSLQRSELLVGKHVLLVDNVLTTGSTIGSCIEVLSEVPGIRISVLTLGLTD